MALLTSKRYLHPKESSMDNMEKLTHPVELFDEELDLVANWLRRRCACQCPECFYSQRELERQQRRRWRRVHHPAIVIMQSFRARTGSGAAASDYRTHPRVRSGQDFKHVAPTGAIIGSITA